MVCCGCLLQGWYDSDPLTHRMAMHSVVWHTEHCSRQSTHTTVLREEVGSGAGMAQIVPSQATSQDPRFASCCCALWFALACPLIVMLPAKTTLPTTPIEPNNHQPTRPRHKNRETGTHAPPTSSNCVVSLTGPGLNAAHIWPQASRLSRPLPGQTLPFASPKPRREATGEQRASHSHVTQQQPETLSCCPSTVAGAKCTDANSEPCQGNRTDTRSHKRQT